MPARVCPPLTRPCVELDSADRRAVSVAVRLTVMTGRRTQRTSATWLQRLRGPLSMPEFHASSFRYRIVLRDVSALSNKPMAS